MFEQQQAIAIILQQKYVTYNSSLSCLEGKIESQRILYKS
jgi:hypothetical protein